MTDPSPSGPLDPEASPGPDRDPTSPPARHPDRPVQYKGADLDPARGPGLGCFWLQIVLLVVLVALTPITVSMGAPDWLSAGLLFLTIVVLLFAGQTIIFLLRLVAAERREGRRRPIAGRSATVGELEDAARPADAGGPSQAATAGPSPMPREPPEAAPEPDDPVRQ